MAVEPSVPGWRPCRECGKQFLSEDVKLLRRCAKCKEKENEYSPRLTRQYSARQLPKE